jgi:Pseudouridine synthase II TruB, C-terminal
VNLNEADLRRTRNGLDVPVDGTDWMDGEQVRMRDEREQVIAVGVFDAAKRRLHPFVVLTVAE